MGSEGEEGIEGYAEYFWFLDCGDGDIVDGEGWFRVHLTGPGSEEGDRGFFGSDAHFVFPGPAGHRSEGVGEEGGDGRRVWGDVPVGDSNGDVVCVGGDHLGRGGAVADEEVEDTGGDD